MGASTGKFTTKAIAFIVIVAMLDAVGLSPVFMVLVTGVVCVIWMFVHRERVREIERVFDFYIAADAILREEERRWYGFEIGEVIDQGESMLEVIPDAPPLNYYALGALHHRLGNHHATVEYLSRVVEDELCEETHRTYPSPQLRRYVTMLRRLEYQPATAPQTLAAIRSLERARQRNAEKLLIESRELLAAAKNVAEDQPVAKPTEVREETSFAASLPLSAITAPPPITKVLHDLYQDETRASN
jgi:hypothetical protein